MKHTIVFIFSCLMFSSVCCGQRYLNDYAYDEETHYKQAMSLFEQSKIAHCVEECKGLLRHEGKRAEDAQVLLALCREIQGFDRAAIYHYKQLLKKRSATGAFHYGVMMEKKGRLKEAEELFQKSVIFDRTLTEAHLHLSNVMLIQGYRFKAMMPLYYALLISNDAKNSIHAYGQLVGLWRRSAQAIDIFNRRKSDGDAFNAEMDKYIATIATSDSISTMEGSEQIKKLHENTSKLFSHLLEVSEENLDFYQVYYSDFFVTLVPRNFVEPYVYYIADSKYHPAVLEWVNDNSYLFNEFRLWMEAQ